MFAFKLIAVAIAYGALWDALGRWRVRPPERRFQLYVYGIVAVLYGLLTALTGGMSPASIASAGTDVLFSQLIHVYFGGFACVFLLVGSAELGIAMAFYDPSLPLLSQQWVQAFFEGPVWRLIARRIPGAPLAPDEGEASVRHAMSGILTIAGALWGLQIGLGGMEWGRIDPVPFVLILRAINTWLDGRIWSRMTEMEERRAGGPGYPVPGVSRCATLPEE